MNDHSSLKTGTICGTLLSILGAITWTDIEKTLVLGAIGAAVSFIVSFFCKKLLDTWGQSKGSR